MRIYSMLVGVNKWNTVADTRTWKMFCRHENMEHVNRHEDM